MKGSLAVLAKFKAFTTDDDNNACKHPVPSRVIDWRLAARLFSWEDGKSGYNHVDEWDVKLDNAWGIRLPEGRMWPSPATQEQFCQDNRDSSVPYTKLILRGMVDPTFRAEGNCIWEKRRWLTDKAVWQLECDVYPTDLVVYMLGFIGLGYQVLSSADNLDNNGAAAYSYYRGGLWLLRPARDDEFKLIACLPFLSCISPPLYSHWEWNPGYFREAPSQAQLVDHCRRLATNPEIEKSGLLPSVYTEGSTEVRKFTTI
jgi:hypothetical protein